MGSTTAFVIVSIETYSVGGGAEEGDVEPAGSGGDGGEVGVAEI
jgi:hypothetical protein